MKGADGGAVERLQAAYEHSEQLFIFKSSLERFYLLRRYYTVDYTVL